MSFLGDNNIEFCFVNAKNVCSLKTILIALNRVFNSESSDKILNNQLIDFLTPQ